MGILDSLMTVVSCDDDVDTDAFGDASFVLYRLLHRLNRLAGEL